MYSHTSLFRGKGHSAIEQNSSGETWGIELANFPSFFSFMFIGYGRNPTEIQARNPQLYLCESLAVCSLFLLAVVRLLSLSTVERQFICACSVNLARLKPGATTSRATSGGWREDRNTSGQRRNKFSTSYIDISVIVGESNSVVRPKYQQYTSLNKMLSNFSKVLMAQISFTAVINNRGIGKGIGCIRKGTKKNYIYVL